MIKGLSDLLDQAIISESANIRVMNASGCEKMQLNVAVLRQSFRNIDPKCSLPRSTKYFELFLGGPNKILSTAQECKGDDAIFSYEEMKKILELCYSEALTSEKREVAAQAQREVDEKSLELNEYMWDNRG